MLSPTMESAPLIQGRGKGFLTRRDASDRHGGSRGNDNTPLRVGGSPMGGPKMRLSPSLPDLTSLDSTSEDVNRVAPDCTTQPLTSPWTRGVLSPTSPVILPPFSPSATTPSQSSPSPKFSESSVLDSSSGARRAKAAGSKVCMNNGGIGKEKPGKPAFLDSGPPLLKRTGHARRYSLGGGGDYPRSISANGVELSRADSLTSHRRPAFPAAQSLSTTAGSATQVPEREEESGPMRGTVATSDRRSKGKSGLARLDDEGSEAYDSDEEFVKLYGLVAQHRAAERAIVSNAFAKVLSKPASGGCSPRMGTGSGCSPRMGSGSGCSSTGSGCSSIVRSGSGFSPKDGSASGCSSIARSRSGCLSMAGPGSGCSPKDGTRSSCSSIIRSSSNSFPKVGSGNGSSPKFTSQSGSGSSIRWAGGDIMSTTNDKTCAVVAADEHEGRLNAPGCADMLLNHDITSVEALLPSPKAAALGSRAAIKGNAGNAPCTVLRNQSRKSLDSAVVNMAFTGADGRESVQSLMDLGKTQISQRKHGHQQQSQREKGSLLDQSGAEMDFAVVGTRAALSPSSKKGLAGSSSSRCNSFVFPSCQQHPFPSHASGSRTGFSRSASESVPHASALDCVTVPSAGAGPRSMLRHAWEADVRTQEIKCSIPEAHTTTGVCMASRKSATHSKPGHRRRVSLSALTVDIS